MGKRAVRTHSKAVRAKHLAHEACGGAPQVGDVVRIRKATEKELWSLAAQFGGRHTRR